MNILHATETESYIMVPYEKRKGVQVLTRGEEREYVGHALDPCDSHLNYIAGLQRSDFEVFTVEYEAIRS